MTAPPLEGLVSAEQLLAEDDAICRRVYSPPPVLTLSEWSDLHRVLSRAASAEPGQWQTDRAPYQRGIMDAMSDPLVERVVLMKSSQVGFTEMIGNACGFYIDQDPAPILMVQPTLEMGKAWSMDRLQPMLRESPQLAGKVRESNRRHSGDTILHKVFPGGHLTIVGANSAAGLASRPIRVALFDEVDRYPLSAGDEGDPITLGIRRTTTFWNRKIILGSTPTLKDISRIHQLYLESDQRRYYVPCPDCGHAQVLRFSQFRGELGENGRYIPESIRYACAGCGALIGEENKSRMLAAGEWMVENPSSRTVGFHISALYSPWMTWAEIQREYNESRHDMTRLQVWTNTILGEPWEDRGGDPADLEGRKDAYPRGQPPFGVAVLTMGVDVQDDRLEYIIRGFGQGEESWPVERGVVVGDPSLTISKKDSPWITLEERRAALYRRADGRELPVLVTCVDSGHHTDAVYAYTGPRFRQRVYATKGSSTPGRPLVPRRPSRNNKARVALFELGTEAGKDMVYSRLRVAKKGPLYYHVPDWMDAEWFTQVTAEKVVKKQISGRWVRRYELPRGARNEALDCEVLCLAALRLAPIRLSELGRMAGHPDEPPPPPPGDPDPPSVEVPPVMDPPPPPKPRGFRTFNILGRR